MRRGFLRMLRAGARVSVALALVMALAATSLVALPHAAEAASSPSASDIAKAAAALPPLASGRAPGPDLEPAQGDFSSPPPTASQLAQLGQPTTADTAGPLAKITVPTATPPFVTKGQAGLRPPASTDPKDQPANGLFNKPLTNRGTSGFDPQKSQVVDASTTPTVEEYANPDGSRTRAVSSEPVRFKDGAGVWHDYDFTLQATNDGFAAKSSDVGVTVPNDPANGVAQVDTPAGGVRFGIPALAKSLAAPTNHDATASFASTASGASVDVSLRRSGFEQDVVVPDASFGASYVVELNLPAGVTARDGGAGVELVDAQGNLLGTFGGGLADDSKIDPKSGHGAETSVATKLMDSADAVAHVQVSVDPSWFGDAARQFPITIDPVWSGNTNGQNVDLFTESDLTTSQLGSTELRVGSPDGGVTLADTLLDFNFGITPGATTWVTESHLSLYNSYSQTCDTSTAINTVGIGQGYYPPAVIWTNEPAPDGRGVRSQNSFALGASGCPAGWVNVDTTSLAQAWWQQNVPGFGEPNYGLYLLTANSTGTNSYRVFASGEAGPSTAPTMYVTYDLMPPTPTLVSPPDQSTTVTTTPTLTWNAVTDPDGYTPVQYWVRVATGTDADSGAIVADSGAITSTSWTVPAGRLRDGETYYWHVWAGDQFGWTYPVTPAFQMRMNLRLGAHQPSPYDTEGPATVNLSTGNLVASHASPQFPTVGGNVGVNYTYDSLRPSSAGLTATYFGSMNLDPSSQQRRRTDANINFDWGTGSPSPGIWPDGFSARWTGYITVPTTGSWTFGDTSDDGVRMWVNNTQVGDWWTDGSHIVWSSTPVTLNAGQKYPVKVEYYENTGTANVAFWATGPSYPGAIVPASWLTTDSSPLPQGWTMSPTGGVAFTSINIGWGFAVLSGADGSTVTYTYQNGGMIPPAGEHGILASDGGNPATWTLTAEDGQVYTFDPVTGMLTSVRRVADDAHPSSLSFTWSGATPPQLTTMTDPVSGRHIDLTYQGSGTCPTPPSGFDSAPPPSMLCKVAYWDGTETDLFYVNGQLARFVDPGNAITDYAYNGGSLAKMRDPLQADAVAVGAGGRSDNDTTRTLITYGGGLTTGVQLAEPTVGAARPQHTYSYSIGADGSGTTGANVTGLTEPNGFATRVGFDTMKRLTSTTDATNLTTTTTWDPAKDLKTSVTDPAGLETSTIYDYADRPTDTYGPAPATWFTSGHVPDWNHLSDVPHANTVYDSGIQGLAATFWNNTQLSGQPAAHGVANWNGDGSFNVNWGGASPWTGVNATNWSARLAGDIVFPQLGGWTLQVNADDGARVWLDDQIVLDDWTYTGNPKNSNPIYIGDISQHHRLRVEFNQLTGGSYFTLSWITPGGSTASVVPGSDIFPRIGAATNAGDADGKATATTYTDPMAGLVSTRTVDPGGANLTTTTAYEPVDSTHYRRPTSRTLPAGAATAFKYYGTDTSANRDNPCPGGATNIPQGGAAWEHVGPGNSTGASRVLESVYDAAGRTLASRIGTDNWTCTTYDSRGRPTQVIVPAFGAEAARTITANYAVSGNPLTTSVQDASGTVTTAHDLLGRAISTTDVWNKTVTTTYDQAGRITDTSGPAGAVHNDYDAAARATQVKLDGLVVATPTYDSAGRLTTVSYPTGTGNGGNGTSLAPIARDTYGRTTGLTWTDPTAATITSDTVTRSLASRITDESIDGTDPNPSGSNFTYDGAGRLTGASAPSHTLTYGYGTVAGCGAGSVANAGTDGNRTSVIDNGTTTTSCYDAADRLLSTQASGYGTVGYDLHGNTTLLGNEELGYDGNDRHVTTVTSSSTVRYIRDATDTVVGRTVAPTGTPPTTAYRASSTAATTGASTLTINKPTGVQNGDVLLAALASKDSNTVTPPTGWYQLADSDNTNGKNHTVVFWHTVASGDPSSWTWSLSTSTKPTVGTIVAYSGIDSANPVDVNNTSTATATTSHPAASVTTTASNDRLVNIYGIDKLTSFTPPSGSTERVDTQSGGTGGYTIEVADASFTGPGSTGTKTATSAASGDSAMQTIALRRAPGAPGTATTTEHYTMGATLDANNNVIERTLGLPGGVLLTKRTGGTGDVWSYPNVHGDVAAVANSTGAKQGATFTYDPYGNTLSGIPDNSDGNNDIGWTGARSLEHETGFLPLIEMGARPYSPVLGRFLQVDPVLGGNVNDYTFPTDPVNTGDLTGKDLFGLLDLPGMDTMDLGPLLGGDLLYGSDTVIPASVMDDIVGGVYQEVVAENPVDLSFLPSLEAAVAAYSAYIAAVKAANQAHDQILGLFQQRKQPQREPFPPSLLFGTELGSGLELHEMCGQLEDNILLCHGLVVAAVDAPVGFLSYCVYRQYFTIGNEKYCAIRR